MSSRQSVAQIAFIKSPLGTCLFSEYTWTRTDHVSGPGPIFYQLNVHSLMFDNGTVEWRNFGRYGRWDTMILYINSYLRIGT